MTTILGDAVMDVEGQLVPRSQVVLIVINRVAVARIVAAQRQVERLGGSTLLGYPGIHGRLVEHMAVAAAAIDLVDHGLVVQVDIGVVGPGVGTEATAIDVALILAGLIRPYGGIDVDIREERTAGVVVTAEDASLHDGIVAGVVDMGFEHVAGVGYDIAVGTAEDTAGVGNIVTRAILLLRHDDGRSCRHVDDGAAGDAFLVAAAIDILNLATHQVDDGRVAVEVGQRLCLMLLHAQSAVGTGTEDCCGLEVLDVLRDVDEDVAALLHVVAVVQIVTTLTGTVDLLHAVGRVADGLEVDEGIVQARHVEAGLGCAVLVAVGTIILHAIVVVTVGTAEDVDDASLGVLDVGRGIEHARVGIGGIILMHLGDVLCVVVPDTAGEVAATEDAASEVIAAIDMVDDVGEARDGVALLGDADADIRLGVSEDIGIAGATEGTEEAAVAQVDTRIAGDGSLQAAAVGKHGLGHLAAHRTGGTRGIVQVDVCAETGIVEIVSAVEQIIATLWCCQRGAREVLTGLSDDTLLATAEDLEHVSFLQVDGGAAPYLRVLTVAGTEDVEGAAEWIHGELIEDDARVALRDGISVVGVDGR